MDLHDMSTPILAPVKPTAPPDKCYVFHEDAAHGWLRVSKTELHNLGIADKISAFSYQKNDFAYLEEDSDLALFLRAKQTDESTPDKKKWVINNLRSWWDSHVLMRYEEQSTVRTYERYSH